MKTAEAPTSKLTGHRVVSESEWVEARKELLAKEKAHTDAGDEIARERRGLPWVKVEKNYVFDTQAGKRTLAELFDGRSQLFVYHFMLAPGWEHGCVSCSYLADHFDGMVPHLNHRDVTFTAISRAPIEQIDAFKQRMQWQFPWASSSADTFNFDINVSFTPEEMKGGATYNFNKGPVPLPELPGASVFYKDESGTVYRTYSAYARGLDAIVGTYQLLDRVPKGRDEDGLAFDMAWVRHHDRYDANYKVGTEGWLPAPENGRGRRVRVLLFVEGMIAMHSCNCTKRQSALAVTKWAVPATVLALVPKCPACVAAYVLVTTGAGISFSTAAAVRTGVIVACVAALAILLFRSVRRRRRVASA